MPFDFFAGAVVNPFKVREPDLLMQFYKLQLKVAAGAQYIITQLGYNLRKLYELKQYMVREGIGHIPVLANVYVPTGKIARMMQAGEIAGCVVTDELVKRLEGEKKPQRLERAALMVAAAKDLGFAGAHIGGFGLAHKDFMTIIGRAAAIGKDWRGRMDEVVFPYPNEFYLLRAQGDGLSDGAADYQITRVKPRPSLVQRFSEIVYRHFIKEGTFGARLFGPRLQAQAQAQAQRTTPGAMVCGTTSSNPRPFTGKPRWDASVVEIACRTISTTRDAPCAGATRNCATALAEVPGLMGHVRLVLTCPVSGTWSTSATLATGDDPRKFARTLVPPRDWCLDRTNALANRLVGLDNFCKRIDLGIVKEGQEEESKSC